MPIVKNIITKCQLFQPKLKILSIIVQQNGMAQYPSHYIEPIYKKEDQRALEKSGEFIKYSNLPTKAAYSDQTCSAAHDPLISLFTNYVMKDGEKALARELVEKSFEQIKRMQMERYHKCQTEEEKSSIELKPKVVFHKAVENCKPLLELTRIKRGGIKYQVPIPVAQRRSLFLSMKWLIAAAKEKERTVRFSVQLARELIDASDNKGKIVKKKQDLHRQCEANRAYAHYRWS